MTNSASKQLRLAPDLTASVIVLNYNGARYLTDCLNGLASQSLPTESYEVVLVDNGSTDGSVELVRREFPWARVLAAGRNLGFAAGNNAGIQIAGGRYIALLNNDTRPHPDWLANLVDTLESHPEAGAAASKLVFYYDYAPVNFELTWPVDYPPASPKRPRWPVEVKVKQPAGWDAELELDDRSEPKLERWWARVKLPVLPERKVAFSLLVHAYDQFSAPEIRSQTPEVSLSLQGHRWARPGQIELLVEADLGQAPTRRLIQNAGSEVSSRGFGRDRGSYTINRRQYHYDDDGRYDQLEPVTAFCGAGVLLRRSALEQAGLLDESFFMYYEDTDLSMRMRALGWDILYQPAAVIRHVHCGTAGEWSPLFRYLVDRNRLLFVAKNFPPSRILTELGRFLAGSARMRLRTGPDWQVRAKTLQGLARRLPGALYKSSQLNARRKAPFSDLEKLLYQD